MWNSFGASVLSTFDVPEDAREFLSQVIESPNALPHETQHLVEYSIHANSDDFHHLVKCAKAIQKSKPRHHNSLDGRDLLTFIWHILAGEPRSRETGPNPWKETDRLINLARELAQDPYIRGPRISGDHSKVRRRSQSRIRNFKKSHYWFDETSTPGTQIGIAEVCDDDRDRHLIDNPNGGLPKPKNGRGFVPKLTSAASRAADTVTILGGRCDYPRCTSPILKSTSRHAKSQASPYFAPAVDENISPKRQTAGIISSVPFPPLSSLQFGLIQEKLAHKPFWLLIAVTFLIKTNGQAAIPVFYRVKEKFPSPQHLADPDNAEEVFNMIRHLGLATNRLAFIQKYATAFLKTPPSPGVLYKVRKYDRRDSQPMAMESMGPQSGKSHSLLTPSGSDDEATMEAWEIGHMTQGKYTLDSWRIFCRDELLGRSKDWNGAGREPEFQPEWMRVMPQDKELRAYLRWMWMREGWEWDPTTGERKVLRRELREAVNERRVEYDSDGGLRVLDVPQHNLDEAITTEYMLTK
ncbi:hypothetical protein QQS21_012539 [Conoideocrella luteorostrata]|uniref:Methyl-CpG-binding domain-containing protein 4 n=1 Tax=Conoideocrella luteorostrata TaxID=1105319 RepID=A0AAJ0CBB3_9HYPO|nr:hypothetical protein QQS21_012539 [Conoideocrella luteorostrata]